MRLGQSMLPEFDLEMGNTREVLKCTPDDKLTWKVHDKSNTIGWVANHLADIPSWVESAICHGSFDTEPVPGQPYRTPEYDTIEAILQAFDKNVSGARSLLEEVADETLHLDWSLLRQGSVLMTMPRLAVVRIWVLNHIIHHRAHLCVYLRVNGVSFPGMYGPTAE
jgi:uncharacterized damage-inducible protein DinB